MFYLKLFGSPALSRDGLPLGGRATQRHRVALLALLTAAGPRGLGRERVMAMLWPESGPEQARNLLKASVYELRRTLGADALLSSGDDLRLNPDRVESDLGEFEKALQSGDHARAVEIQDGPFLDGFFLKHAPTFERWVDVERERLARARVGALVALAEAAERRGDLPEASEWWGAASTESPYDSRLALGLMRVLEAVGNHGGALKHAEAHDRILRTDLDVAPSGEIRSFVERLRARGGNQAGSQETQPPGAGDAVQAEPEPRFRLRTLGALALESADGSVIGGAGGDELGLTLLAVLASAGARGVPRETLLLYLWPDAPWREADTALDDLLRQVRERTEETAVAGSDPIVLDGSVIASDLAELERARGGVPEHVLALTRNTFLEGVGPERSHELAAWIEGQRRRLDALRMDAEHAAKGRGRGVPVPPAVAVPAGPRLPRPRALGYVLGAAAAAATFVLASLWDRERVAAPVMAISGEAPRVGAPARPKAARETTQSSAARDLFDHAAVPARFRNDSVARASLDLFRRAVQLDPDFAGAHAHLAMMFVRIAPTNHPSMPRTSSGQPGAG